MHIETSTEIDKIAPAIVKAQSEIGAVTLNKVNPHFRSKYADLAAIREATRKPLANNDLSVIQAPASAEGRMILNTMLLHSSGQWIQSSLSLKPERAETPQAMGSAITYARRYALAAMLGIVAEEDDDGNAASVARSAQAACQSSNAMLHPQRINQNRNQNAIIFDKHNKNMVDKIAIVLREKGLSNHLDWIIEELHGKEMKSGIVTATVQKRIEALKENQTSKESNSQTN